MQSNNLQSAKIPCNKKGGYVYIFETKYGIKIGKSENVERRFNEIEAISGKKIERVFISPPCGNYGDIERRMHKYFEQSRIAGEWFNTDLETAANKLATYFFEPLHELPAQSLLAKIIKGESYKMATLKYRKSKAKKAAQIENFLKAAQMEGQIALAEISMNAEQELAEA